MRDYKLYLIDIVAAIESIEHFVANLDGMRSGMTTKRRAR